MRSLASIQQISSIEPITNADKIELAHVLGWQCVIKKGEFKAGDLCTYIEIDSIVPEKPEYEFLRDRKFRVRTIRLRGVYSQGLLLSAVPGHQVGADVTEALGIIKYDPQAQEEQALEPSTKAVSKWFKPFMRFSLARKLYFWINKPADNTFPEWLPKTDETRIQAMPSVLCRMHSEKCYATEKLDGCSATYCVVGQRTWYGLTKPRFMVFSRNVNVTRQAGCLYLRVAKQYELEYMLTHLYEDVGPCAVQGEIIGEKIQGNKYGLTGMQFRVFNMFTKTLGKSTMPAMQWACQYLGLETVPILDPNLDMCTATVGSLVSYATRKSTLANVPAEGVVIRTHDQRVSFKVINPEFLVKYDA